MIRKAPMHHIVQHRARIRHTKRLTIPAAKCKVLGKGPWQHAPNTIGIQFQRTTNAIDQFLRHLDDSRSGQARNTRHLHRVPTSTFAHDITIERIKNALVG